MARYLDTAGFTALTIMPAADVAELEAQDPGWLQAQIDRVGAHVDARLAKRYAVPFGTAPAAPDDPRNDVPLKVEDWIVAIVTMRAYARRGVNPSSGELWFESNVIAPANTAAEELKEAANSNEGLFDLPLLASSDTTGISRGGPLTYSETSPYVWQDVEADLGKDEDDAGVGT